MNMHADLVYGIIHWSINKASDGTKRRLVSPVLKRRQKAGNEIAQASRCL